MHELAHAGTIGAFGFGPSRIILAGLGGVTFNERRAKPWQDLLISLAGPRVNPGVEIAQAGAVETSDQGQ